MEILFWLVLVAGVLAVVGHGLWLLFAAVVRAFFGDLGSVRRACVRCGWAVADGERICSRCGLSQESEAATELSELEVVARRVRALAGRDELDAETSARVLECVARRRDALLGRAAAPARAGRRLRLQDRRPAARPPDAAPPAPADEPTPASPVGPPEELTARLVVETPVPEVVVPAVPEDVPELELIPQETSTPPPPPVPELVAVVAPAEPAPVPVGKRSSPPDEVAAPVPAPREAAAPRRSWTDLLAGFMEEKNILWGELVGGLLIVGCSTALVVTLWQTTLEHFPYFPALVSAAVTLALLGAGRYTLSHWKLEATSRGLLVIATLLVPLNLLVLAGLARERGGGAEALLAAAVGLPLAAAVVAGAARVLVPGGRGLLTLGVVGAGASELLVPHLAGPPGTWRFLLPAWLAVACHAAAVGLRQGRLPRDAALGEKDVHALLLFLGMVTVSVGVALGFLLAVAGATGTALQQLAPALAVAGVPILSVGLIVQRRLGEESPGLGGFRAAGTAVALAGLFVLLGAVALAWPHPGLLLAVCAADCAVLTALAFRERMPVAHLAALPCLVLGWLIAFHAGAGHLSLWDAGGDPLASVLFSPDGGAALAVPVVLLAGAAELLARRGRREDAAYHGLGAVAVALASLGLIAAAGVAGAGRAALVCALYGAMALLENLRWQRPSVSYAGQALLLAATLAGLQWAWPARPPAWGAVLALEALALAALAAWRGHWGVVDGRGQGVPEPDLSACAPWHRVLTVPCHHLAWVAVVLSLLSALSAPGFPEGVGHTLTAFLLAAATFLLVWVNGVSPVTWLGAAFAWAGATHLLVWDLPPGLVPHPWTTGLLASATLFLFARLALPRHTLAAIGDLSHDEVVRRRDYRTEALFTVPLRDVALFASVVAVPVMLAGAAGESLPLAGYAAWVGLVWLVLAWAERSAGLLTACQVVFSAAVALATAAWVEAQPWGQVPADFSDPRTLQAVGAGLGLLCLLCVGLRVALRRHERARELLEPPWPAWDRIVLGAVVAGQLVVACWGTWSGVALELAPRGAILGGEGGLAAGPAGWLLLAILAAGLTVTLWDRAALAVLGLTVLALTVPVLAAARWEAELATATALRWGLGLALLACSVPLWLRDPLRALATRAGIERHTGLPLSPVVRAMLVLGTVVPVLALTTAVARLGFAGLVPSGPAAGSLFADLGWVSSNVVPLVFVCVGLVGYALRERSPGYAFAAGLVADAALMGGYALAVVLGTGGLDEVHAVHVLQLGSLGAGVWALAWLLVRPWVATWREVPRAPEAGPLMLAQLALALAGNGWLLALGLLPLLIASPMTGVGAPATEIGSLLGWLALLAALAAPVLRLAQRGALPSWDVVGLAGLAVAALLACTVERHAPGWGYRAFLFGVAAQAVLWSVGPFVARRAGLDGATAAAWVARLGLLVVLVALKGALVHEDWLTAAGAVGLASPAATLTAAWLRRERWAFAAGLGANLAAALAVSHFHTGPDLWLSLVQAAVIAGAAVALLWLLADRCFGLWDRWERETIPLLGVQSLAGVVASTLLLVAPLSLLIAAPDRLLPLPLGDVVRPAGWAACLLASAAALGFSAWRLPRLFVSVLGTAGASVGVLAACLFAGEPGWLSYHVLTACGAVLGTVAVVLALAAREESRLWPAAALRHWAEGLGLALVGLGLRAGWEGPLRPYSSAAPVLLAALMSAVLALGFRRSGHVFLSGGLLALAGVLGWVAWGPGTPESLASTVALSLAAGSIAWTLTGLMLPGRVQPLHTGDADLPFEHVAVGLALLLAGTVVLSWARAALAGVAGDVGILPWSAVLLTTAAFGAALWDARARFATAGLFATGLLAAALALGELSLGPPAFVRVAVLVLAGYALLTAALARVVQTLPIRPPQLQGDGPRPWFRAAEVGLVVVVVALSLGVCLSVAAPVQRLAGPAALLLLLPACVLLGRGASVRYAVLGLGALACVQTGWAWVEPAAGEWLHRSASLFAVLTFLSLVYDDGLRSLPPGNPWRDCGRRVGGALGVLAVLVLPVLIGQEFVLFDRVSKRTPLSAAEVVLAAAAILAIFFRAIRAALVPRTPGESRGRAAGWRTLYVYAAEVLLLLLFVHLRLNAPWMVGTWMGRFWPVLVMVLAYLGVGLGELFHRRGLPVLAGPLQRTGLFLPLLPILVFWLQPPEALLAAAESAAPGLAPLLSYLRNLPRSYTQHALLWFGLAVLYGLMALSRQRFRHALQAALAANFSLWALLAHLDVQFLLHPQAWLIPLALIVLASEQLNRDRLTREQGLALRYVGLSMVYVSSTADLFIAGVGSSLVLPVVLAVLSVLGVLGGILLRVRAFLYMGVTFLCLDVFAMIWHAAVDRTQTWVWYVSGIVLGSAILALFALFEKRRNDVLRLLEEFKRWD